MTTERIEAFYRDATAADVLLVMNGEKVEARFQDQKNYSWFYSNLSGWKDGPFPWGDEAVCFWQFCQIYEPPQYWLDKPEPGEGYRLLAKFPDEPVLAGDFIKDVDGAWRELVSPCNPVQGMTCWYRRKIEQPKPEPKFAVGQRVKIVGPPIKGEGPIYNWCVEMDKYIGATEFVRSQPQQTFEGVFYQVSNIANWSFREDYLEAVAEPEPKHYTLNVGDTADVPSGHRITALADGIEVQ